MMIGTNHEFDPTNGSTFPVRVESLEASTLYESLFKQRLTLQ
jgi:hypothetical protein